MPAFISDKEFAAVLAAGDVTAVAEKADAFIQTLTSDIETAKAKADAASITAEQTCSILEQKFISLSSEFSAVESRNLQLDSDLQQRSSELAQVQSEKHQLYLKFIEKDGEIERLKTEVSEVQKSKRQLLELLGVKDAEINDKNSTIKSYVDKISDLTDRASKREARVSEIEAELLRCRAHCEKSLQEKELFEKHNAWLNAELTAKVDSFSEQRRKSAEFEADMSAKLADIEKQYNECSSSLNWHKDRVRELELNLESLQRELCSTKDDASTVEQRYSAEISTVSKLVDLYKESSQEWSQKAGELEGVIKALETQLSQTESEYKDKCEKEAAARREAEKETSNLTEKVLKLEAELESSRRASELDMFPPSSFTTDALTISANASDLAVVPHVASGVSGTALAASLLREGWSLAKMYANYQEAADALRHEQMGRKQIEATLERILFEIEEKASILLDERVEHERTAEAYALMSQKLQQSVSEQGILEKIIRELKAEVKKCERERSYAQKETTDLQNQVTILLKECRDVQLRCGSVNEQYMDDDITTPLTEVNDESDIQKVISEHLVSVKDIKGLVEQNAKLRNLVRSLSDEVQIRETQVKEQFGEELQKHKEEAASRVAAVLERAEEQGKMIESLHSSVSMFKRLFEEEHRLRSSGSQTPDAPPANEGKGLMLLVEHSQENAKRVQEQASERVRCLEDELASLKTEIISLRSERDKLALEANFAQEKLERFVKEFNHQREESNGILVRNIEFSQIIVNYQKKLRESSESVHSAEELTRKLNMELAVLRREKELLLNSEKRAQDEVLDLSQRVYRLQASLDTVLSTEQVREESRAEERRKSEEHINQIERQLAEAQNELQEERNNVRTLSLNHELTVKDAMRQVEDMGKRLEVALQAVIAADRRAAATEAKYSDLERNLKLAEANNMDGQNRLLNISASASEGTGDLAMANQEIERLKSEALASKDHMEQYKGIAQVNEAALKQMESAHEGFKLESEQLKMSLESEIKSLRDRVLELENESSSKWKEAASAASQKDEALASAMAEITALKEEASNKVAQFMAMEVQVSVLKEDLDRAHERAHAVQANYERQVILQAETIQELTKTSKALALLQEEASELRRTAEAYKSENIELKAKWVFEKSELEKSKNEAEKKYDEVNDQNKILHSQLEVLHLKLTEKESGAAGIASASTSNDSQSESGLHSVVSYLRRSREIAETEISLLKQEKLRLQAQLERALKATEASLSAERTNSRSLFKEDEFKALKLQVNEINLLRESNMQLREENRHNFEECQKLREAAQIANIEAEKLQNIVNEREHEIECFRKEIELCKKEKELLERRISDMAEASEKVNLEDYNLLKSEVEDLKASVKEKEAVIEDTSKVMSQNQELIAKLEQDLGRTRLELSERDGHVAQVEALKLEVDKQKKIYFALKRRTEAFSRDKEALSKQKEALLKEKDTLINEKEVSGKEKDALLKEKECLGKEKDALLKEKEVLLKEKEALNKEKQAILKQLEDLRGEKKATLDTSVDFAAKEKEKEKDIRIKSLEFTVSKQRKEKEKRQSIEKLIIAKVESVDTERKKFQDELGRQKEAVRKISDELEKLKHARDSLPVGTSVVHLLSGNSLDDLASAYVLATENFERESLLILNEVASQGSVGNSSAMDATPVVASSVQVSVVETPVIKPFTAPPICPPTKAVEESETKVSMLKTRKLVRPQILKSGEPRRNVEMSDAEGSKSAGNPSSMQETAIQSTVPVSLEHSSRKRLLSPPSDPQGEQLPVGDPSTDVHEPILKKSKGLDSLNNEAHAQTAAPQNVETVLTIGQLLDSVTNVPQVLANTTSDFGEDAETVEVLGDEGGESEQPDDAKTLDIEKDNIADNEYADKEGAVEQMVNETSDLQADQDDQHPIMDDTTITESRDAMDAHPEQSSTASMPSPSEVHDVHEMISSEISNANEHMEEGELAEDVTDVQDKSINDEEGTTGDVNHTSEAVSGVAEGTISTMESVLSRENSSNVESGQNLEQPSQVSGTINIADRARARAATRLARNNPASASPSASASASASTPPVSTVRRGRGGAMARNRGRRGGRQG